MKIKLKDETKEYLKPYNFLIVGWCGCFLYMGFFGVEFITGRLTFSISSIWTQALVVCSILFSVPWMQILIVDFRDWIKEHYKNGVLTI